MGAPSRTGRVKSPPSAKPGLRRRQRRLNIAETVGLAWSSLLANKVRSVLTMLGVIIGIAAVIVMVTIGQGAQAQTDKQLQSLGSNLLFVQSGTANFGGPASQGAGSATTLTWDDAKAIAATSAAVAGVAPVLSSRSQVVWQSFNTNTTVQGTTPQYVPVADFLPLTGRFFNQADLDQAARVAVLGQTVVSNLGLTPQSALGQSLRIRGEDFVVIGTLEYKGANQARDQDDEVLMPLTTMASRIVGINAISGIALNSILVSAKSPDQMDAAQFQITNLLRLRHKIVPSSGDDFIIRNQADLVNAANSVAGTFTALLAGSAAISLVVGGIGIMNMMLVSVRERTREIGVRKAIGARSHDILWQFLIEALVLAVTGGGIGIALGLGISALVGGVLGWPAHVATGTILLSFGICLAIGLFFGVVPARQAAHLDPITALHTE
ncbi:ABC transporter permease [Nodosilinea nodulosa]|uniref:ABC transporter permease n=1 Tax=Nodosilinea nodulosa TaxID=416001 RepID=UPI0002F3F73E|nr:ABC transporter permease [Nodosilinea nodulosa]